MLVFAVRDWKIGQGSSLLTSIRIRCTYTVCDVFIVEISDLVVASFFGLLYIRLPAVGESPCGHCSTILVEISRMVRELFVQIMAVVKQLVFREPFYVRRAEQINLGQLRDVWPDCVVGRLKRHHAPHIAATNTHRHLLKKKKFIDQALDPILIRVLQEVAQP
jgi:hypothetical protein